MICKLTTTVDLSPIVAPTETYTLINQVMGAEIDITEAFTNGKTAMLIWEVGDEIWNKIQFKSNMGQI